MIQTLLNFMPSGLQVSNEDAHMLAQAQITSIQEDMDFDLVNGAKAGQAICNTSSFKESSFMKKLRNLSSLELPAPFVRQHGNNFQVKVVLQGPSGRLIVVHLTIELSPIQDRVHFRGSEWRDFLLENGFKMGHELIFSLVSNSIFIVRHSGATNTNIQESVDRIEKSQICHDTRGANLQESNVRPSERLVEVCRRRDSSVARSSHIESPVNYATADKPWASHAKSDVVYARNTSWDSKHFQTVDMLVGKLQCPHFVLRINKSHLREWKSCSLSVPREFYNKYANYFSDGANIFQGPNGRMMNLRFSDNSLRFTSGWKAFHRENSIKLGDVMLFSLCEPARWLIQFVERKLEEVPVESECDSSE